jgi:ubiquinone/menaquinone biosynthesis C-methylase UbiE
MDIRGLMYRIYWQAERIVLPGFKAPQSQYEDLLKGQVSANTRWLDVGAGHQVLSSWRFAEEKELVSLSRLIVGFDHELEALRRHRTIKQRCQGDMGNLPFRDNCFDLVTANMVVEHLQQPTVEFREVYRTLRAGGLFVFHTPNGLGYSVLMSRLLPGAVKRGLIKVLDGRRSEDIFKTYYYANTQYEILKLAKSTGFEVSKLEMICASADLAVIPPLAVFELFCIKLLTTSPLRALRSNIIAVLRKP